MMQRTILQLLMIRHALANWSLLSCCSARRLQNRATVIGTAAPLTIIIGIAKNIGAIIFSAVARIKPLASGPSFDGRCTSKNLFSANMISTAVMSATSIIKAASFIWSR